MRLGHTPAKYLAAWRTTFAAYHQLFPNQYMALALYPGPPIGNAGGSDPTQGAMTPLDVIAAGLAYKQNLVLQEDGLKDVAAPRPDPEYNSVKARCGDVVTGLQNATSTTTNAAAEGPLGLAIDHAVAAGVDFLEVYEPDLLNPAFTRLLSLATAELPAAKGCAPLTLSAVPQQAPAGTPATLTVVTDLDLAHGEDINVYAGTTLVRTCATTTCSVRQSPGSGTTTYGADVGAPGTPPASTEAIVSTTASVSRGPTNPTCSGSGCP
jgi:hypothetical protein